MSLNGTSDCTSSQVPSHKISVSPMIAGSSPDSHQAGASWLQSCLSLRTDADFERGRSYVEVVQLLSLRSAQFRRLVRTGRDFSALFGMRRNSPAGQWIISPIAGRRPAARAASLVASSHTTSIRPRAANRQLTQADTARGGRGYQSMPVHASQRRSKQQLTAVRTGSVDARLKCPVRAARCVTRPSVPARRCGAVDSARSPGGRADSDQANSPAPMWRC